MVPTHLPGDAVTVLIEGRPYRTFFDDAGTQRFHSNGVLAYLRRLNLAVPSIVGPDAVVGFDLERVLAGCRADGTPARDVAEFLMALGFSVDALRSMHACSGWRFVNTAWGHEAEDPAEPDEDAPPPVTVDGIAYETVLDAQGVRRFRGNAVVRMLTDRRNPRAVDLNELVMACEKGAFSRSDYAGYYAMLGYSIDGFLELTMFEDCLIEG